MCKKLAFLVCVTVVLCLVSKAPAIEYNWVGGGDNSWCVDGHWSPSGVPGPEDTATISGAVVGPTIDCDVNVGHISGPRGGGQVITVTGGHIVVQNVWAFGSTAGMGTINISGSPIIEIYGDSGYGRGWFGSDEGSSTINISGDPDIYVDSGIRGADDTGSVFDFSMSGGDVNCGMYMIGDNGSGDFYLTGGTFICRGEFKIRGRGGAYFEVLIDGGAELIVGGWLRTPEESEAGAYINLDDGYIECKEWGCAGENWFLDINEGMIRIKDPVETTVEAIQGWIDAGQITGYNNTETPQVTTDGSDIVVTVYFTHFKAYEPNPAHNATDVCPEGLQLHWMQGVYVDDHNVYFGTNMSDVNESALPVEEDWGPNTYTPTGLELGKTYYWRIDTVKDSCDASPWEGAIWQFTTENGKAKDPSPEDEQRGALPDSILSWIPCCVADGQKLYFATDFPERIVLFEDDFESGAFEPNWTNSGWDIWDANDDPCWAEFGEHDHNLARATGVGVKTLTSTNIDTSDYANTIEVSLWVRTTEPMGADELQLKYYNGSTYNTVNDFNVVELDPNGRWVHFTDTITDSQYLINNFGIKLVASISGGTVYVDDVTVTNSWPVDPNWWEANLGANDNNYAPTLSQFAHYYWRIDTVYDGNLVQGDFWDFTTGFGGLIMYYKFNGSQGNNIPSPLTDSTGNVTFTKYTGTGGSLKYGESNPVIAESTASADFDPCVGLYRDDTGENDPLRLAGWQYTIEFWVKPENLDESLDIDEGDPNEDWLSDEFDLWLIGKFDSWKIAIKDPGGDGDEANTFHWDLGNSEREGTAVEGQWTHLAVVYDQTSEEDDNQFLYMDGELISSVDAGSNPSDSDYPVTIGYAWKDDVNVGRYFDGLIDEVRIYDVALTPCEFLLFPGPEWASCPNPSDGETEVDPCTVKLMWTPGQGAVSHDVYFSSDYDDVNGAGATAVETTYGPNSWTPPTIPGSGTVYYWRVDTYDNGGPPYEGVVWQFTTKYTIDDEHLILWYKFDETSGDDAIDASGYGHHGDVDEEDNWDPDGHYNGCLLFDDDQAVDVPSKVTKYIGSQISISVWLNGLSDQRIRDHVILDVSTGEAASYAMRVVVPDEDGDVYWRAGNDSNDALVWDTATPKGWRGDWHHLVFIKDEDAGTMSIYFDADLKKDKSGTLPTLSNLFFKPFKIGAYTSSSSDYEGFMDDLRVYDYAIPESKVIELFRGGELCLAWGPSPADGQQDAHPASDLVWEPGDYASSHEVYFGTNKQDVEDANNSWDVGTTVYKGKQGPNTYDPGPLTLDQRYYWRIDEVNDTNDKLSCRGDIWKFKVANYIVIDDFEDYENSEDLWGSWIDGALNSTGAFIALQSTSPISTGNKSMQYLYYISDFGSGSYYAQIQTTNLDPNNWDVFDGRILSLWFYGKTGNDANTTEQMYVALEDNDGNYAEARYPIADMDDIRDEEWYEWKIFLSDFTNVNRAKLETLFIGFGDRDNTTTAGGTGTVHFDDIRVYPPHCVPEEGPEADLSGNCVVDFADIEIMADEWLEADVNLGEVVKPDANGLVGWWKFDEAAADTNIATDYSDYDNNGVIETLNDDVWWVAAGHDGNALEFDGGVVEIADDGNTPELRPIRKVSVMAWINRAHSVDNEEKVVVKGHDNWETYALEVSDENLARFLVRDANDRENQYTIDSPDELPVNSWVHVAGTYDGNELTVYVNGQVAANSVHPLWEKLAADANDGFAIAGRWGDTGGRFIGTIDDVRVYNYGLSLEEVRYIATDTTGILALESIADLYKEPRGKGAVNLKDFAELAKSWLEKKLWPE